MAASSMHSSLYESTHAAVILNSGGMVVLWSRAAEQLFGWTAEDMEGRPAAFLSPANRSLFLSCLNDDRQGGINRIRCRTRSGQDRDLTVAIMPITGHAPEDTHCLGLFLEEDSDHDGLSSLIRTAGRDPGGSAPVAAGSDLADRLRFESLAADLSRRLLQVPGSHFPDLVPGTLQAIGEFFDSALTIFSCGGRTCGGRASVLLATAEGVRRWMPGEDEMRLPANLFRHLKRRKVFSFSCTDAIPPAWIQEKKLALSSGVRSGLWIRLDLGDHDPGFIAVHGGRTGRRWDREEPQRLQLLGEILLGASHRHRMEQELTEAKQFFDSVVTNIPLPVFVKDATTHRFVYLNRACEELVGVPGSEVIGKTNEEVFHPEDAAAFSRQDQEVLATGSLLEVECETFHSATRGALLVRSRKIPLSGDEGNPRYIIGITEDITGWSGYADLTAPLRAAIGTAGGSSPRVLFVDQAEEDAARIITGLHNLGCLVTHCRGTHSSRLTFMASPDEWAAVVIDDPLPMMSWVELIQDIRAVCPEMPILFIHDAPGAPEPRRLAEIGKARSLAKPVKSDGLAQALGALLSPA
ncbi:MAG: PAS domain-containing protein [Candidatus Krumholzibacteriia bacterium]